MDTHVEAFANRHLLKRCFKTLRVQALEDDGQRVLSNPVLVWACFRMLANYSNDASETTYSFPWDALIVITGTLSHVPNRLRVYAMGKLFVSPKKLPLLLHATGLLDAYVMRVIFSAWKAEWNAIISLRNRCLSRILRLAFEDWRMVTDASRRGREVMTRSRLATLQSVFASWKMVYKQVIISMLMKQARKRIAIVHWFDKLLYAKHCRRACSKISPYITAQRKVRAFDAWTMVWTYRLQLQRFANQVACARYRNITHAYWGAWVLAASASVARRLRLRRLEEAVRSRRKLVSLVENKRLLWNVFKLWMMRCSNAVRGRWLVAIWTRFNTRRRLRRYLRKWSHVVRLDKLVTRVQKRWRGIMQRNVTLHRLTTYLKWFRRKFPQVILFREMTLKRNAFLGWTLVLASLKLSQETKCKIYNMQRGIRKLLEHRAKGVLLKMSAAIFAKKLMLAGLRRLSEYVCQRKARIRLIPFYRFQKLKDTSTVPLTHSLRTYLTQINDVRLQFMRKYYTARALYRLKAIASNLSYVRSVTRALSAVNPRRFFLRLKQHLKRSLSRKLALDASYKAFLGFHFKNMLKLIAERIIYRRRQEKILFYGLCRVALLRWLARAWNLRLQRAPRHRLRLQSLKRLDSLLLNRRDPRRPAFLTTNAALQAHFSDGGQAALCKANFIFSARKGKVLSLFNRWFRRSRYQSRLRALSTASSEKGRLAPFKRCFGILLWNAFSMHRFAKLRRTKCSRAMDMFHLRKAFKTLYTLRLIRDRSTRLIYQLRQCFIHAFRHMRTLARQRGLLRARSQMGAAYHRMKILSGAISVWIRQTHGIYNRLKDAGFARLKRYRDASQFTKINVGTNYAPLFNSTPRKSSPPLRDIRNSAYARNSWARHTADVSARSTEPLDSSVRTEWGRMGRSARFSDFDISPVKGDATFVVDSYKSYSGNPMNSKLLSKMRRKLCKLLENQMKVRLFEGIHARYIHSVSARFPASSECKPYLLWIFTSQRRGLCALFYHAYFLQTIRLCRLKLELRPILRSWKSAYKRRVSLHKHLKSITVRILVRIIRGTFNAWSLYTVKQIRLRAQATKIAVRSKEFVLQYSWQAWLQSRRQREINVLADLVVRLRERKIVARMLRRWKRAKMINRIAPGTLKETTFAAWVRFVEMRREKKSTVNRGEIYFLLSKLNDAFRAWYQKTCGEILRKQRAKSAIHQIFIRRASIALSCWIHKTHYKRNVKGKTLSELSPIATSAPSLLTPHAPEYKVEEKNTSRVAQSPPRYSSPLFFPSAPHPGSKSERSSQSQMHFPASGTPQSVSRIHISRKTGSKSGKSLKAQVGSPDTGTQRKVRLLSRSPIATPRHNERSKASDFELEIENKQSKHQLRVHDTPVRPINLDTPVPRSVHIEPEAIPIAPTRPIGVTSSTTASSSSELAKLNIPSVFLKVNPARSLEPSQLTTTHANYSPKFDLDEFFEIWSKFALSRAFKKWERISARKRLTWARDRKQKVLLEWRRTILSNLKRREAFISKINVFLSRSFVNFYFNALKKYSFLSLIQRKLGEYTERQRLLTVWGAWRVCSLRRKTQRSSLDTIFSHLQKHNSDVLRLSFATWRVVVFKCPILDLSVIGTRFFRQWLCLHRAMNFRSSSLKKTFLFAWRKRVGTLHNARNKVFKLKRAIAVFESRLRQAVLSSLGKYYRMWVQSTLSPKEPSANYWQQRVIESRQSFDPQIRPRLSNSMIISNSPFSSSVASRKATPSSQYQWSVGVAASTAGAVPAYSPSSAARRAARPGATPMSEPRVALLKSFI